MHPEKSTDGELSRRNPDEESQNSTGGDFSHGRREDAYAPDHFPMHAEKSTDRDFSQRDPLEETYNSTDGDFFRLDGPAPAGL